MLINLLRDATHNSHQALHVHPLLAPLQQSAITLQDYGRCLQAFHIAYLRMGRAEKFADKIANIPVIDWLEKDMRLHGFEPCGGALPAFSYPEINTYSRYIGYLYVVQGSGLGGQVISKHLQKTLGLIPGDTNHFFAGFGAETGQKWKQFLTLLQDTGIDQQEAVNQAVKSFALIAACCNEVFQMKKAGQIASCG